MISSLILACAVCGAAEPTLPTHGAEVAFAGRKRATLELRAASFATKDRALHVTELRAEPGIAAAVAKDMLLGVDVPLLRRSLSLEAPPSASRSAHAPTLAAMTVGDVELRVSHTAWRNAPSTTTEQLSVLGGLKLPTATLEHDPSGAVVAPDLQPGCGSVVPVVGASFRWAAALWSAWASASLLFPVSVRGGAHPGDSLRVSAAFQLQPRRFFATRLGVHGRLDGTGEIDGEVVRASGGTSMHVAPELVLSPVEDLVVGLGASFPLLSQMRGYRATTPVLLASVGLDF